MIRIQFDFINEYIYININIYKFIIKNKNVIFHFHSDFELY